MTFGITEERDAGTAGDIQRPHHPPAAEPFDLPKRRLQIVDLDVDGLMPLPASGWTMA